MTSSAAPSPVTVPVLGWKEQVELPGWGLTLPCKLDTGARTSALHVTALEPQREERDPETGAVVTLVRFDVVLGTRAVPEHHPRVAAVVGTRIVKDTRGRPERRPVVRTTVRCGPLEVDTELTLTDRTGMNFRMLLGRRALEGRCLVDPERGYLVTRRRPAGRGPSPPCS